MIEFEEVCQEEVAIRFFRHNFGRKALRPKKNSSEEKGTSLFTIYSIIHFVLSLKLLMADGAILS